MNGYYSMHSATGFFSSGCRARASVCVFTQPSNYLRLLIISAIVDIDSNCNNSSIYMREWKIQENNFTKTKKIGNHRILHYIWLCDYVFHWDFYNNITFLINEARDKFSLHTGVIGTFECFYHVYWKLLKQQKSMERCRTLSFSFNCSHGFSYMKIL